MTAKKISYPTINYDTHARSVPVDDYWGQVKRTVNGKQIEEEQINLIVNSIVSLLDLNKNDVVLDLACGNGALSSRILTFCSMMHGVDISPYLIDIAKRIFLIPQILTFEVSDVIDYMANEKSPERFTKALVYGSYQYFPKSDSIKLLKLLYDRFINLKTVVIGNIPDRDNYNFFYVDRTPEDGELDDSEAYIGVWYNAEQLRNMASEYGWKSSIHYMPSEFYATSYRFNLILER